MLYRLQFLCKCVGVILHITRVSSSSRGVELLRDHVAPTLLVERTPGVKLGTRLYSFLRSALKLPSIMAPQSSPLTLMRQTHVEASIGKDLAEVPTLTKSHSVLILIQLAVRALLFRMLTTPTVGT